MKIQEAKDMQQAIDKAAIELNHLICEASQKGMEVQIAIGENSRIGAKEPVTFIVTKC